MKIKNDKIHSDLVPLPFSIKVGTFLLSKKFGFKINDTTLKKMEGSITKGLENQERYIKSNNGGPDIRVRIYRPENNSDKLPVMLYNHGGGYAIGNPEMMGELLKSFIDKRPCLIVAPGYRRSLTNPYPAAFNDCYDTLLWIRDNADAINVDANKLMVAGHSAGGGLTAAITLKVRETKDVKIAFQMPIYPMIDDRHQKESSQFESPIWGKKSNHIGWELYLKDLHKHNQAIPNYAAPARNKNYTDFPPTLTFVGGIDPFRDDTIEYVEALKQHNIPVKFKVFDGCYHSFELAQPKKQVSKDATNFLFDNYVEFYDKYIEAV